MNKIRAWCWIIRAASLKIKMKKKMNKRWVNLLAIVSNKLKKYKNCSSNCKFFIIDYHQIIFDITEGRRSRYDLINIRRCWSHLHPLIFKESQSFLPSTKPRIKSNNSCGTSAYQKMTSYTTWRHMRRAQTCLHSSLSKIIDNLVFLSSWNLLTNFPAWVLKAPCNWSVNLPQRSLEASVTSSSWNRDTLIRHRVPCCPQHVVTTFSSSSM